MFPSITTEQITQLIITKKSEHSRSNLLWRRPINKQTGFLILHSVRHPSRSTADDSFPEMPSFNKHLPESLNVSPRLTAVWHRE